MGRERLGSGCYFGCVYVLTQIWLSPYGIHLFSPFSLWWVGYIASNKFPLYVMASHNAKKKKCLFGLLVVDCYFDPLQLKLSFPTAYHFFHFISIACKSRVFLRTRTLIWPYSLVMINKALWCLFSILSTPDLCMHGTAILRKCRLMTRLNNWDQSWAQVIRC